MPVGPKQQPLAALRQEVEGILERSGSRRLLEPLLHRMLDLAQRGDADSGADSSSELRGDSAVFAHHRLAELLVDRNPWRAALHVREVAKRRPEDADVHALMGLCQVLLGNYRFALKTYEKAVALDPENPWYHHNVGHLLDIALGRPNHAEPHLRLAFSKLPKNHEVMASLAHCLGRLGNLEEAKKLARRACKASTQHQQVLDAIDSFEQAAGTSSSDNCSPQDKDSVSNVAPQRSLGNDKTALSSHATRAPLSGPGPCKKSASPRDIVLRESKRYLDQMQGVQALRDAVLSQRSRIVEDLWVSYEASRRVRMVKPEVCMAALVCAALWLRDESSAETPEKIKNSDQLREIAKDFGVSRRAVASRFAEICDAWLSGRQAASPISAPDR